MSSVSIIITTYFRNNELERALQSVYSQNYNDIEVIVVDDSGEGHSKDVIENYNEVKYICHEKNRGAHSARNTGLNHATGKYIQFLDDDDILKPSKIKKQVKNLERNNHIGVVYCGIEYDSGEVELPSPEVKGNVLKEALLLLGSPMTTSTLLIRSDVLTNIQPLDCDSPGADDLRLNIKLAQRTSYDYISEALVLKGHHEHSRGSSWGSVSGRWRILLDFEPLYDTFEPQIRKKAIGKSYRSQGYRYLDDHLWSFRAILSFVYATHSDPNPSIEHYFQIIASFFGRPGIQFAYWVKSNI